MAKPPRSGAPHRAAAPRPSLPPVLTPLAEMFHDIEPPLLNTPTAELVVQGASLDLHDALRFVGLTLGADERTATLGWAPQRPVSIRYDGSVEPLGGMVLTISNLTRCEVSLQSGAPGALEYFELRRDPEVTLLFFFEGGTMRLSGASYAGEILLADDSDSGSVQ